MKNQILSSTQISKRGFLKLAGAAGLLALVPQEVRRTVAFAPATRHWTATGYSFPQLVSFDTTLQGSMQARNISGGALAVKRNNRLVLARGYTYTDDAEDLLVLPLPSFPFRV